MEMGVFSVFIGLAFLVAGTYNQNTDLNELAGRSTEFGTALYRKIASASDDNVVISPLAATLGLASLAAGAKEDTRRELMEGLSLAPMERREEPERVPLLLQQFKDTAAQTLATGIFTSQQFQAESGFSSQVKTYYGTGVQTVDFARAAKADINRFVAEGTGNKIMDVVNNVYPQNQLMLISAAYFTGQWQLPFNGNFTQVERFFIDKYNPIYVPMMIRSGKYYLAYDPLLKVGILKLQCMEGIAVLLLLPDEDVDYTFIDEALTSEVFHRWVVKLKKTKLEVQLPKFSLEQTLSLKRILPSLEITKVFEDGADLSGISSSAGLKLSEVIQKTLVEVDENGGSAIPASGNLFMDSLPPRLTFNRPFLFIVYHEATRSLLHMGRVVDPSKK